MLRGALASLLTCAAVLPFGATAAHADAVRDRQWYLDDLGIRKAQKVSKGEGVTVAVVDTGVEADHPDLTGRLVPGADGFSRGRGTTDYHDHGTGMASLVGGRGHGPGNANGILGVAPRAKIMPIAVMGPGQNGATPTSIAAGIIHAVEHGADIVLVTMAGPPDDSQRAAVEEAMAAGVLVVASAGQNEYGDQAPQVGYPAAVQGVLAVSAVDRRGRIAPWSAAGPKIAVAAPGVDLPQATSGGGYATRDGTSGAAAIVAGIAALLKAEFPDEDHVALSRRIAYTAVDKGPKGRDHQYGFGIPDVNRALSLAQPPEPPASPSPGSPVASQPSGDIGLGDVADTPGTSGGDAAMVLVVVVVLLGGVAGLAVLWRRPRRPDADEPGDGR